MHGLLRTCGMLKAKRQLIVKTVEVKIFPDMTQCFCKGVTF